MISNAIKFTQNGKITIKAENLKEEIKISVTDTGIGIPEKEIESLFNPKHSKSTRGTNGEGGTGLGLLICKEYVNNNDGEIYATSTPGKGSTFSFTLHGYRGEN